jgi:filamentous hemagglutinin
MVGTRGADIISVNTKTNEVTLWDNKYRTANTPIKDSPTFKDDPKRLGNAKNQALEKIKASQLPESQKNAMRSNIEAGNFTTVTVGDGNASNSVITIYRNHQCVNCGS